MRLSVELEGDRAHVRELRQRAHDLRRPHLHRERPPTGGEPLRQIDGRHLALDGEPAEPGALGNLAAKSVVTIARRSDP